MVDVRRGHGQDDRPQKRGRDRADGAGEPLSRQPAEDARRDLAGGEDGGGAGSVAGGEAEPVRAQLAPAGAAGHLEPGAEAVLVAEADGAGALAGVEELAADVRFGIVFVSFVPHRCAQQEAGVRCLCGI